MYYMINNINGRKIDDLNKQTIKDLLKVFRKQGYKKQFVLNLNRKAYVLNTVSDFKSFSIFKV